MKLGFCETFLFSKCFGLRFRIFPATVILGQFFINIHAASIVNLNGIGGLDPPRLQQGSKRLVLLKLGVNQHINFSPFHTAFDRDARFVNSIDDEEEEINDLATIQKELNNLDFLHKQNNRAWMSTKRRSAPHFLHTPPPLLTVDPRCNSESLQRIMIENMGENVKESKRNIIQAAEALIGGTFNVICAKAHFSYNTYEAPKFDKQAADYARPPPGSKTEARARRAGDYVMREIIFLCETIYKLADKTEPPNCVVKFGPLFQTYSYYSDKLVGMLIRARKYGLVSFDGEMLYQRQDDHKEVRLLKTMDEIRQCVQYSGDPVNCIAISK